MDILFKIIGAFGLLMIIIGVLVKPRGRIVRDILYIIGGIFLTTYSIYIRDVIFIILQIVFVAAAIYDMVKLRLKRV